MCLRSTHFFSTDWKSSFGAYHIGSYRKRAEMLPILVASDVEQIPWCLRSSVRQRSLPQSWARNAFPVGLGTTPCHFHRVFFIACLRKTPSISSAVGNAAGCTRGRERGSGGLHPWSETRQWPTGLWHCPPLVKSPLPRSHYDTDENRLELKKKSIGQNYHHQNCVLAQNKDFF